MDGISGVSSLGQNFLIETYTGRIPLIGFLSLIDLFLRHALGMLFSDSASHIFF